MYELFPLPKKFNSAICSELQEFHSTWLLILYMYGCYEELSVHFAWMHLKKQQTYLEKQDPFLARQLKISIKCLRKFYETTWHDACLWSSRWCDKLGAFAMLKLELASVAHYSLFCNACIKLQCSHARSLTLTKLTQAKQGKPRDRTIWNPSETINFYSKCFIMLG